jgi:hypothetical protein
VVARHRVGDGDLAFATEVPSPARWINAGLAAVGVLLTWMVAIAVRTRYPQRPMATLLFMLTALLAIHPALGGSSAPICSRWPAWRAWPAS